MRTRARAGAGSRCDVAVDADGRKTSVTTVTTIRTDNTTLYSNTRSPCNAFNILPVHEWVGCEEREGRQRAVSY